MALDEYKKASKNRIVCNSVNKHSSLVYYPKTSILKDPHRSGILFSSYLTIYLSEATITPNLPTMAYKTGLICLFLALGPAAVLSVPMPEVSLPTFASIPKLKPTLI